MSLSTCVQSDRWLSNSINESYESMPIKEYEQTDPELAELENLSRNLASKLERINDDINVLKKRKDKCQDKTEKLEEENCLLEKENEELEEEIKQLERTLYLWQHQEQMKSPKHKPKQSSAINRVPALVSTSFLNKSLSMKSEEDPEDDLGIVEAIHKQIIEMRNTFQDQAIVLYQLQDFVNETYNDRIEFQKIVMEVENDKKKASKLIEDYYVKKATTFESMKQERSSLFGGSIVKSEEDMTFGMHENSKDFCKYIIKISPKERKVKKNLFCQYINSKKKKALMKNSALYRTHILMLHMDC
ncbi:unnamed protein product [Blepharisma stoltei]|uniref:Uncharacterized protein n=1 Tax=Blepharisma stoltei TaxID=1481888 RepID=A0AAU9K352_9CILI|nr:unnamed protein product [Blepharisma stoltei]